MLSATQRIRMYHKRWKSIDSLSIVLLALSLGLGSTLSTGCVAVPAVMLTSATVTTAALVTEGERLVETPEPGDSVLREAGEDDSQRGKSCHRQGNRPARDRSEAFDGQGTRNQCAAGFRERESAAGPDRPRT
jgi:hypothetical protein